MKYYYKVSSGSDIGGRAGVAYIKNYNELYLLPKEGTVTEWETKHFYLKDGEYTDCLPANIGCRLCSKKMRDILERNKSNKDALQWLDAEVESEAGEKRQYFILHFPVLEDVLDKRKSKYAGNILTKHVINPKACAGHEVFSYIEESTLSFIVSQKVREELKKAGCRGLIYIQMSPKKRSYIPRTILKFCRIFNKINAQDDEKITQRKRNINWANLEGLNLPKDLVDFIGQGKSLSYDKEKCVIGQIELVTIDTFIKGRIYVDETEAIEGNSTRGYYVIPAVDLIAECEGFDAWGLLVWLPEKKMFGSWDSDHRILRVFPNIKWADIVKEPIKYLNVLWEPQKVENIIYLPNQNDSFINEHAKQ